MSQSRSSLSTGGTALFAAALLCACQSAGAPKPVAPVTTAIGQPVSGPPRPVSGVLLDSLLTNDVLRGALLSLDGATTVHTTTDRGAFRLDSVTPGLHRLVVRHPLLDSLGIDTIGVDLRVGLRDEPVTASLPTAAAFVLARCGVTRGRVGEGLLIGVVRRADSDEPVAGVEVAAAWRGTDTTYAGGGLRERARVRTSEMGRFAICRAPRFSPVEIWARNGVRDTPRVRVQLGAASFAAYDFSIEQVVADTVRADTPTVGSITGRVLTLDGEGLPNVSVRIDRPDGTAITDQAGRFSFGQVPAGVRAIDVRALGFRPSRVGINLRPAQRLERDITLDRTVAVLGTVTVRANRAATWDSVGFDSRRKQGSGYFFTRENLKGITDLATALRLVPGIRGKSTDRNQRLIAGRGNGCFPAFVVNGVRFAAGGAIGPEAMIRAEDVRGMEVYTSRLSTPPEHQRYGDCAVIVIWLRDPQAEIEASRRAAATKPRTTP
ncbi:MAG: carboxypeptidase regulatory-like domain-containing protein [Gemmatimonadota bacterium]